MAVSFDNITEGTVDGTGWFDRFLRSTRAQLNESAEAQEITQEIYGKVLSAAIGPMMSEAVKYELSREGTDADNQLKAKDLELKDKDLELKEIDLSLKSQQVELMDRKAHEEELMGSKNRDLIDSRILNGDREIEDQEKTSDKKRDLLDQQILESEQNVKSAARKVASYDDQLLLKITEMQGNVASFFVNSSPSEAAPTLADLKHMMQTVSVRTGTQIP